LEFEKCLLNFYNVGRCRCAKLARGEQERERTTDLGLSPVLEAAISLAFFSPFVKEGKERKGKECLKNVMSLLDLAVGFLSSSVSSHKLWRQLRGVHFVVRMQAFVKLK
jgi:hypothetical protein